METVMLIGGAGFIGSHLVAKLNTLGYKVIVYDCLKKPLINNKVVTAYAEYRWKKVRESAYKLIVGDVCDFEQVSKAMQQNSIDTIVYLSALLSAESANNFQQAYEVQVEGLRNFLEASKESKNLKRVVFISSSYVYGDFQHNPATEAHRRQPVDIYGRCKLIGEELTQLYSEKCKFDFSIVRMSGVYGFGDSHVGVERIAPTLIHCASENEPLIIKSAGSIIDFTYVKDAVEGLSLVIQNSVAANQTFNITRGEARTIADFARDVKSLKPDFKLTILDERQSTAPGIPKRGALDISKAHEILGYSPKYNIETGIEDYLMDYENSVPSWRP